MTRTHLKTRRNRRESGKRTASKSRTKKGKMSKNKTVNSVVLFKKLNPLPKIDDVCSKFDYKSFEKEFEKDNPDLAKMSKHDIEKTLIKTLNTPYDPTTVRPQDDFYTYINYNWLKYTRNKMAVSPKINKYYVEVDNFRIVQNTVYHQLMDIVKNYIKTSHTPYANKLKNMYKSLINLNANVSKEHIRSSREQIDMYIKDGNMLEFLAHINNNKLVNWACPIQWEVKPDLKDSTIYRSYISSPQLSLYDYYLYTDNSGKSKEYIKYKQTILTAFLKYVNKIFDTCYGKNHGFNAQDVFDVEYQLLLAMGCDSVKGDSPDFYNVVKAEESMDKYGFDWNEFSKLIGYDTPPPYFICGSLNYLKCVSQLLKDNWNTPKWSSYWHYIYLRQLIRFNKDLVHIYYEFNGHLINGQPEPFPEDIYPIFGLAVTFNTFLSNQYVEKYANTRTLAFAKNLGDDLLTIFKRVMNQNSWLSPRTKKYALLKLEKLKFIVGQPDFYRGDPLLDYTEDDPWQNMLMFEEWKTKQFIKLTNKPVIPIPSVDWQTFKLNAKQPYIVDAYYTPSENSIYIPVGYLQEPFVDLNNRGIEYNLAHLGDTLAHEMSHSLDNTGSKYDWKGNLFNWWTPEDMKRYKAIIKDIVKQYETFASYDKIKFDATIGLGEDMADISGLSICEEYLRDFQAKNREIVPIRADSFREFYTCYAVAERQFIYKNALTAQLKTNPHPLDKYRTNVPLSRLELFRSLYNIKKGDKMFWQSTSTIW